MRTGWSNHSRTQTVPRSVSRRAAGRSSSCRLVPATRSSPTPTVSSSAATRTSTTAWPAFEAALPALVGDPLRAGLERVVRAVRDDTYDDDTAVLALRRIRAGTRA